MRDHVGDRLRLARAGGTIQHEIATAAGSHHCRELRGVRRERREKLGGGDFCVQPIRRGEVAGGSLKRLPRSLDEVPNHRARFQLLRPVREVLPHQVFGEGEDPEAQFFHDLEAGDVPNGPAHHCPDGTHVDAVLVDRQVAFKFWDGQLEVVPQQLEQGHVETRFVLMRRQDDARPRALSLQCHRQQDQRRAVGARVGLRAFPVQETQGQEEGVRPAFLQIESGLAVEFDEMRVELLGGQGRKHFARVERLLGVRLGDILARSRMMELGVASACAEALKGGDRLDADLLPLGEQVFQPRDIGADQLEVGGVRLGVKQTIPDGEVQEFAPPLVDSPLGG